ncbi:LacI family DNA-binding transcriptional regulator [Planotetraspora phitsanulokensis]|uniref:LacI family transcriptional regulator n=1 Tax=Planotetraspora phitsanulokensis TaxID=575192 RepID=A0A8J3XJA8_9ACTN|nr:LacI family DNA-binding transcriptional regulator [Planotetraspora phitsanulokensis]GII42995.1 LacI family transcriptional regulator [Planotetraspora phitsanulokensis]
MAVAGNGRAVVMTDVARLAGVSSQTVSRVLNEHPRVSPATRERVLAAVRQLNYHPNALARGLAGGRSRVVGVISFNADLYGPAATLLGIERAAHAAGYGLSIATVERVDYHGVLSACGRLADQSVDGVIVITPQTTATAALHRLPRGMAAVAVSPDPRTPIPAISVDQVAGARLAVTHLLELGHRNVWHVTGTDDSLEAQGRVEGWRATLEQAGITSPPLIRGDWSARSGYQAGLRLAGRKDVTAVFAGNDQLALGMLRAFAERGVRVPEDVSVVGFDDIPEAEYLVPPLTTIRQDFGEVGRRCMAALLPRMRADLPAGTTHPAQDPTIQPTLIVRRTSTTPPR